jgi:surface antigen
MITHDARRSLSRGNNPVPSPWQATASNTNGTGTGNWLAMQNDGNLVLYNGSGKALWASKTIVTPPPPPPGTVPAIVTVPGGSPAGTTYAYQHLGYPYPNAPECTNGGKCVPDIWSFYEGQCTSWASYRLDVFLGYKYFVNGYRGQHFGAAQQWGTAASNLGILNHTPAVGAVAWYYFDKNHGHVAYVEKVNSPTSVVISEMNYDNKNGFRVRTITTAKGGGWPTGFIHIHDR